MKIPVFEEIAFNDYEPSTIQEKLDEGKIGRVPCFINLTQVSKDERPSVLIEIKNAFIKLNLNPRFPFPCYVVGEKIIDDYFPSAESVKELPDHFFKKVKRPNNKEIQLLNKLALKVEKIRNLEMNGIFNNLKDAALTQKKLYDITKELYFLEVINYKLIDREKEKEKKSHGKKA